MKRINQLMEKGVIIPHPESVYIAPECSLERISSNGVTLFPGTRLTGSKTLIMDQAQIGEEGPVTLNDTFVGKQSRLKGGFFNGAVFLGGNEVGSCAHVRPGTILEEQASAAHCVGLKQTILFPFVTLGSLINFCDCFMAGGTSRKDHSEVGSSFIHFNYTPNQDKATPSMMGNIHQGVMLDQPPIFLGGQGGLVGPRKINFGCISAAGSILRKDENRRGRLLLSGGLKTASLPWAPGTYTQIGDIYNKNIQYISSLMALKAWYTKVRILFCEDFFSNELFKGLVGTLDGCIHERIKRLEQFCEKLMVSKNHLLDAQKNPKAIKIHDTVIEAFPKAKQKFENASTSTDETGVHFIKKIENSIGEYGKNYITAIKNLSDQDKQAGSQWLLSMEENLCQNLFI